MDAGEGPKDNNKDRRSRVQQLVALLPSLQSLDPLAMHLFGHLIITFLLLLGRSTVLDALDVCLRE